MKDYEYDETLNELRYKLNKVDFKIIPKNLKILILPDYFNEVIEKNSLPETLEVLIFGKSFNQKIKGGILPKKLKVLILGDSYDQQLNKNTLPKKLKILSLGSKYKQEIDIKTIPIDLEVLEMHNDYNKNIVKHLLNLKILRIYDDGDYAVNLNELPKSIEFLDLKNIQDIKCNLDKNGLPNLKILKIDGNIFNNLNDLDILAPNVKFIELYNNSTNNFVNVKIFPKNLEYLVLNSNYIEPGYNPKYEYYINFKDIENNLLSDDELDENKEREIFQEKIQNLKYLSLHENKKQKYLLNNLPFSLETIKFYKMQFEVNNLPITISKIYLEREDDIKYLNKIPFGCRIDNIFEEESIVIHNHIVNNEIYNFKNIVGNIKELDIIGCEFYTLFYRF